VFRGIYSLLRRNIQFLFEFLQSRDEGGFPLFRSFVVKFFKEIIGFTFATGAFGKLIAGETGDVRTRVGKLRGFEKGFARPAMVFQFVPQKDAETFVKKGAVRIIFEAAIEVVAAEFEILPLVADTQGLAGLRFIVQRRDAGIPRHVPRGHVPIKQRARLQGGHRVEKPGHATPLGSLPGVVGLDPKIGGQRRAKPAQRGEETHLPDAFAEIEVEGGHAQSCGFLGGIEGFLKWNHRRAGNPQQQDGGSLADHSSRPAKTKADRAKYTAT